MNAPVVCAAAQAELALSAVLTQEHWQAAGRALLEKCLAEFLYEEVITAQANSAGAWTVQLGAVCYQFSARQRLLGHWAIVSGSVLRDGEPAWDLLQFVRELAQVIAITPFTLTYLQRELSNTWLADVHLRALPRPSSDELLDLSDAQVSRHLHGHPWIVMSKGRIGFSYDDYRRYAPESAAALQLPWVAVSRALAHWHAVDGLSEQAMRDAQLDADTQARFTQVLTAQDLVARDYIWLPVHPWQWDHWLINAFAGEIAARRLVWLGFAPEAYQPLQSIRTLANTVQPHKPHIKLPLSILNTAVYRGLPGERTELAPALSQWLGQTLGRDPVLKAQGLLMLREIASVNVPHQGYESTQGSPYQFRELFGCLWRESVDSLLVEGEQAVTQAALVHVDAHGKPLLASLIKRSGLTPEQWLARYFAVCLPPLLHCLYRYGLVFSPHGENTLLVHQQGVPTRLVVKDFIDDINLIDQDFAELASLPAALANVLLRHPPQVLGHFIFTGLFVVHYRYISEIAQQLGVEELTFWALARTAMEDYHAAHPELAERIALFDMQRAGFEKVCLNRVRLLTQGYADDAERPVPDVLAPIGNPISAAVQQHWRTRPNHGTLGLLDQHGYDYQRADLPSGCVVRLRQVQLARDLPALHRWMNAEHVIEQWQLNHSLEALQQHFTAALADPHHRLCMVSVNGLEIGYMELYHAATDRLGQFYPADGNDWGWHLLIGEAGKVGQGYAEAIIRVATQLLFAATNASKVVGEPDHRVKPYAVLAERLCYEPQGLIEMPEKTAMLYFCPRERFIATWGA
ncbi:GNAT family N-acetyltransferase [Atopomonas sediminilitoris]|uniref:GNAT family N-acetyltransferase n=1 Tax=Atopomonas sediminilitoris TaxID=2919919 RepID=UPI001F4EAE6B|nr:GNAT family N-acetyltransferase [Atopomonas sediminilitoris]MCJ8167725.1 GNAT family N-acetyltransferase [Atopomonas sediminilitoris]